jgi:hypothetical protein
MRNSRFIVTAMAALATAAAIAGCSAAHPQPGVQSHSAPAQIPSSVSTPAAVPSPSAVTTASPVGIWNAVSTSDPSDVYGQYSITESDGQYILTTVTQLKLAGGLPDGCSLPPGTQEATFSASSTDGDGPAIYEGTEKSWYANTCGYSFTYPATLGVLSVNQMDMTGAITLIRAAGPPSQPPAAASSPVTASASPTPSEVAIPVTVPAICTPPVPVTQPGTLAEWLSIQPNYAEFIQDNLVDLLQPYSTDGEENALNSALCLDSGYAKFAPPPVDVAGYATVLKDAVSGYLALHDSANGGANGGGEPPAYAAARPYFEAAEKAMVAFYAAIGHPIRPGQGFPA